MKTTALFSVLLFLLSSFTGDLYQKPIPKVDISINLGGPASWGSFGAHLYRSYPYEKQQRLEYNFYFGSSGFADASNRFNPDMSFSLGSDLVLGRKHSLIMGAGFLANSVISYSRPDFQGKRIITPGMYIKGGYRYQITAITSFQIEALPTWSSVQPWRPWATLSYRIRL